MANANGVITWHELMASDTLRQQGFYGELLGWEFEQFKPGEFDYPVIKTGGGFHGGLMQLEQRGAPSHWLAYVDVPDVDATAERAKAGGANVHVEPREIPDVGRFTAFADPQGGVIAAIQNSNQGPVPRGTFVWDELLTKDLDAATRFYGDVFGWSAEEVPFEGGVYTLFKVGEQSVAGTMVPPEDISAAIWQTYIGTADVDATTERARELGATVYLEPMSVAGVGRLCALADPGGAVFGLFTPEPS
jgi:uncharacterized protein